MSWSGSIWKDESVRKRRRRRTAEPQSAWAVVSWGRLCASSCWFYLLPVGVRPELPCVTRLSDQPCLCVLYSLTSSLMWEADCKRWGCVVTVGTVIRLHLAVVRIGFQNLTPQDAGLCVSPAAERQRQTMMFLSVCTFYFTSVTKMYLEPSE